MARRKPSTARPRSIAAGRPSRIGKTQVGNRAQSSRRTRSRIRTFHRLQKDHATALEAGDEALARTLTRQITSSGGLDAYQRASLTGQSTQRGGDSTRKLLEFLDDEKQAVFRNRAVESGDNCQFRCLDVGALTTDTALSNSKLFHMTRIDLNSQMRHIQEQDFMERPLPSDDNERFDLICLSLVLNFVPTPKGRGEMLKRTRDFLITPKSVQKQRGPHWNHNCSCLWLVLPAPCVVNSRYLDESKLCEILKSLGFKLLKSEVTAKLFYSLWRFMGSDTSSQKFMKCIVRHGRTRNNFAITLD